MDATNRLRIATRIHFALLRQYGEQVAVSTLLADGADAREALWVCEASGLRELTSLAAQLKAAAADAAGAAPGEARPAMPNDARPAMPRATPSQPTPHHGAPRGAAPQALAWAQDTTGFGLSRPLESIDAPARGPARGLKLSRWWRGEAR